MKTIVKIITDENPVFDFAGLTILDQQVKTLLVEGSKKAIEKFKKTYEGKIKIYDYVEYDLPTTKKKLKKK